MKRVVVWLASPTSNVAHRKDRVRLTACGVNTREGSLIDWQLLNPKRVRLCQRCWSPLAVQLAPKIPDLPACERAILEET